MGDHEDLSSSDDHRLLCLARGGDGRAFETLYRRDRAVVLAYLARRVSGPELAADLLAECFAALLVVVRDPQRELPTVPLTWLMGTAKHLLIDSYRRGRVEAAARVRLQMRPLALDDRDLQRIEEISAETDLLGELQSALPPDQFQALRARVIDERDYAGIARELQCSQAVIRKRVSRALTLLRSRAIEGGGDG